MTNRIGRHTKHGDDRLMQLIERRVSYFSEGDPIAAVLYLPGGAAPGARLPAVVLCHGFTGIKELILPDYARAFAAAGFAALAFDYRGFGESGGPRGWLVARRQIEDIRNSITLLETVPEVDPERIGLWGTSYGAANVVVAAALDERARCVVAQVGFADGGRRLRERPPEETAQVRSLVANERHLRVMTGKPTMVEPLTLLSDPESTAFFNAARERLPALPQPISLEFLESTFDHRPIDAVASLSPRALLLIAAELDTVTPASEFEELYCAARDPKRLVVLPGVRHYEIYSGHPLERSRSEAALWFKQHLA